MKTSIILILLISLFNISCSKKEQAPSLQKINIATSKNLWCALTLIASEKGFFKEEGLDANLNYQQSGRYCLDAVLSKSAEFGNIVEANVAYIGFTGVTNLNVVGTIVTSTSSAIIASKSKGIKTPEDIRGKKLALSPGTTSDIFAYRFLEKYNISLSQINLVSIQPIAMQGALTAGGVDAASSWEPFLFNIRKGLGGDAIQFSEPEIYLGYENIVCRKDWANSNKEIVAAYLRANKKAENYIRNNKEEAQKILARAINLDLNVVKAIWNTFDMRLVFNKQQLLDDIVKEGKDIIKHHDEYKNKDLPNYNDYLDDSFFNLNKSNY